MAKSYIERTKLDAERELSKSIDLRIKIVNEDVVSEQNILDQGRRLEMAVSRVQGVPEMPDSDKLQRRLQFELAQLVRVAREAKEKQKDRELAGVA